jgi:hypothetical protein
VSPREVSDWEVPENTPHVVLPHYYQKDIGWTFFLCSSETIVRIREIPRYPSRDTWNPYRGKRGVIFVGNSDISTIIWIEGKLIPFDPPYVRHWSHYQCRPRGTRVTAGSFAVLRYEDGAELLHNEEHVAFDGEVVYKDHVPGAQTQIRLGIRTLPYKENPQEVYLESDPLVDMLGHGYIADIPVFWNPRERVLYGCGFTLDTSSQLRADVGTCLHSHVDQIGNIKVPGHEIVIKREINGDRLISLRKSDRKNGIVLPFRRE